MADHGSMEVGTATGVDYEDHRRTYLAFVQMVKYSIIAIVLLLIFLAWWHG